METENHQRMAHLSASSDEPPSQRQRVAEAQPPSSISSTSSTSNDQVAFDLRNPTAYNIHPPPTLTSGIGNRPSTNENEMSTVLPQSGWFGLPLSSSLPAPPLRSNQSDQPARQPTTTTHDPSRFNGIPEAVKTAVVNYQPTEGFELVPQKTNERSFIFYWGVRVKCMMDGVAVVGWICLGNHTCRQTPTFLQLYGGRTSRATKHLKEAHGVSSDKSAVEDCRKRSRDEEVSRILAAAQTHESAQRISLLLQTLLVVNNNLPFVMGEWEESEILKSVITKDDFKTVVNRHTITHSIVELYASGKTEITKFVRENMVPGTRSLTMSADFWLAKTVGAKFMGLRIYFVTSKFELCSILLGTRHFLPMYGERATGIGGPFKRWILRVLEDFELRQDDFYGATTDGGSDVKRMMRSEFNLKWEWCIPHLTNAATKAAFGLTSDRSKSKNRDVLDLLRRVTQTTFQVKTLSSMGDLYEQLIHLLQLGKGKKLLDYKPHRFMGLTRVLQRIVHHWSALERFYEERKMKRQREKKPTPDPFPLASDKNLIEQLLALLIPVTILNKKSQAELPNQVEVLLTAFKLYSTTLNPQKHLLKFNSTRDNPISFHPIELLPIVSKTRTLLQNAFHTNLFQRYTDRNTMKTCSFIWEMQLMLHPNVKHLDKLLATMVRSCGQQMRINSAEVERNVEIVIKTVTNQVRAIMVDLKNDNNTAVDSQTDVDNSPPITAPVFDENLMDLVETSTSLVEFTAPRSLHESRIDLELQRWTDDVIPLKSLDDGSVEPLLHYWKRLRDEHQYTFLPNVARVIFSVPASSAQIERDFGVSGMMVTSQRTSLSPENIDMCSFINRNRKFIDLTQCAKLTKQEAQAAVPANIATDLEPSDAMAMFESDWEAVLAQGFSATISMEL